MCPIRKGDRGKWDNLSAGARKARIEDSLLDLKLVQRRQLAVLAGDLGDGTGLAGEEEGAMAAGVGPGGGNCRPCFWRDVYVLQLDEIPRN